MQRDIRDTDLFREAADLHHALRRPGTGLLSDASEISTNGLNAVFTGTLVERLSGLPPTRICSTDLATGDTRVLTFGPNTDRLPKFSPNGQQVAFLSDRHKAGDFQLYLLDPISGAAQPTMRVEGWVEYFHWSPDGTRILLGVAGHGADIAGGQGAVTTKRLEDNVPSWMPEVGVPDEEHCWRSVWVYETFSSRVRRVSQKSENIWEAAWCGNECLAAIVSPGPREGLWYKATLHVVELDTGKSRQVYAPKDQLGRPAACPSGEHLAFVEAVCSDRGLVAGDLRLMESTTGNIQHVDTRGVDVTFTEWRSDRSLLLAGQRGFETVIGLYDTVTKEFAEHWASSDVTTGGFHVAVCGLGATGDCVLVGESFVRAPEVAVICSGEYRTVRSFDLGYTDQAKAIEAVERICWHAPDGLEIQGWLLRPKGNQPFPMVMNIHGGPAWQWRPTWLGRRSVHVLMLLKRGYAVFLPNPRGSTGRGQRFVRLVVGDMGGADTYDYLSGIDHLVKQDVVDPRRLGVTGGSYGGFMTSWLITQDSRFAAAVSLAPVTNQVSQHLISNIPDFVALFLADRYQNPTGKYFSRSPIMHAHNVKTATLNICGALDRCTPPQEAEQFHNALLEHGTKSVLVTYPEEGHGIRNWPAMIDYAARAVAWFQEHLATPKHAENAGIEAARSGQRAAGGT